MCSLNIINNPCLWTQVPLGFCTSVTAPRLAIRGSGGFLRISRACSARGTSAVRQRKLPQPLRQPVRLQLSRLFPLKQRKPDRDPPQFELSPSERRARVRAASPSGLVVATSGCGASVDSGVRDGETRADRRAKNDGIPPSTSRRSGSRASFICLPGAGLGPADASTGNLPEDCAVDGPARRSSALLEASPWKKTFDGIKKFDSRSRRDVCRRARRGKENLSADRAEEKGLRHRGPIGNSAIHSTLHSRTNSARGW